MTSPTPQTAAAETVRLPQPNLVELHRRMARLARTAPDRDGGLRAFLELTAGLVNAGAAVLFSDGRPAPREREGVYSRQALAWSADLKAELQACAAEAMGRNTSGVTRLARFPQAAVIAAPVGGDEGADGCLCVVVLLGDQAVEPFLAIVQLLGAYLDLWTAGGREPATPATPDLAGRLAGIMARVAALDDRRQAELALVNELKTTLDCDTVLLATADRRGRLRLEAVSDLTAVDERAEYAAAARGVFDECALQRAVLCWPRKWTAESIPSPICGRLTGILNAASGLCLPLVDAAQRLQGACMLAWSREPEGPIRHPRTLETVAGIVAGTLAALARGPGRRWKAAARPAGKRRALTAAVLVLALAAAALVPVTYRVKGPCSVTPVVARVVSAPFDGILQTILREPGTLVARGEVLARMDGRVIDLELGTLAAELQKARKTQDVQLASGNTAAAQIAALESRRLEQKIKLMQRRRDQLDIVAPIEGVVLTGRLAHGAGSPVRKGQFLFEVSPLKNMRVEVSIDQQDISYVRPGMPVQVTFDAYPRRRWQGDLQTILPRSEIRDGRSVFVGQVTFANDDGSLRPGMRGQAAIATRQRPLVWIYFHRPWYALLDAMAF